MTDNANPALRVTISGAGSKHELDLSPDDTIRSIKARLESPFNIPAASMKLLVKGKAPADDATVAALKLGSMSRPDMTVDMIVES